MTYKTTEKVMISLTDSAVAKISELLGEEKNPNLKFRAFIRGGGCSGFSYGFTFDEEQAEDDVVIDKPGMILLIDSMSMQYLQGSIIDYKKELMGSSFVIQNPNSTGSCGCGSSFSV